ncbi:hypothetical protein [Amycolatopsis sp. NPDC051716]|jgi:hypothetical protein|uniref:hypothetical protein n=1 Tax=Amycolatopsis sp. NPDC051716 TaxID=3155804 RepID=UPI0034459DAF
MPGILVTLILKAQRRASSQPQSYSINLIGKAARNLFRVSQRHRWTWMSPPAAADRAPAISYPAHQCQNFLYFSAALEAVGRTELIPKLRACYADNEHLD